MYYCVNILLSKNALEHGNLEDEFVQNKQQIAGRLTWSPSHAAPPVARHSACIFLWHFPVEARRPLTSMGLLWTVFFSAVKLDGHWINAAIMSRPRTPGVSGVNREVGWPGVRASAWWLEDCISFWLTAISPNKKIADAEASLKTSCSVSSRILCVFYSKDELL